MLLTAGESPANHLSQPQRAFLLAAVRSALISRHPEHGPTIFRAARQALAKVASA